MINYWKLMRRYLIHIMHEFESFVLHYIMQIKTYYVLASA